MTREGTAPRASRDVSALPPRSATDVLYILDLSSWARGMYEGARQKDVDVDDPESNLVALGVTRRFVDVLGDRDPAFFAVAMDTLQNHTWRHELWPPYKQGRPATGAGYARQLAMLLDVFVAHRIPVFQGMGFEADDFIGVLTRRARAAGLRVVILSKDHDLWQLFETAAPEGVIAWDVAGAEVYTHESVQHVYGVPPEMLVDHMALVGDGDEAPGIKGIGPKKAANVLKRHGSLETALARWQWQLPQRLAYQLRDGAENARLSRKLVELAREAPFDCSLDALALGWSAEDAKEIGRLGVKYGLPILRDARALEPVPFDPELRARWAQAGGPREGPGAPMT